MDFNCMFYELSNGNPPIPLRCYPYLFNYSLNRNTFFYIFSVIKCLHIAFPFSVRMELYFMTLCTSFGRDYSYCKKPDYDVLKDMRRIDFFRNFSAFENNPDEEMYYYDPRITHDDYLISFKLDPVTETEKLKKLIKSIEDEMPQIDAEETQKDFIKSVASIYVLKEELIKIKKTIDVAQSDATFAGIDLKMEIFIDDKDTEDVISAKKRVKIFILYLSELISRKDKMINKFSENVSNMIQAYEIVKIENKTESIEKVKNLISEIKMEELNKLLIQLNETKPSENAPTPGNFTDSAPIPSVNTTENDADKIQEHQKYVYIQLKPPKVIEENSGKTTEGVIKEKSRPEVQQGGKTLRKRVVYNKTRNKLNRKSKKKRY